jgi:DNA invertase Pin-like site-specific DNA recombinase
MINLELQKVADTDSIAEARAWAIYARTAVANPLEIARQLSMCLDLGVNAFKDQPFVYFDDGKSGILNNRADFLSLMRSVAAGHLKAVVVSDVDRISRSCYFLVRVIEHFDTHKAVLFTTDRRGLLTKVDRNWALARGIKSRQRSLRKSAVPA